eukprot:12696244-Prorocentrum_lima.AAC.1
MQAGLPPEGTATEGGYLFEALLDLLWSSPEDEVGTPLQSAPPQVPPGLVRLVPGVLEFLVEVALEGQRIQERGQ